MRVEIDGADDRRIGQVLIGLRSRWPGSCTAPNASDPSSAPVAGPRAQAWSHRRTLRTRRAPTGTDEGAAWVRIMSAVGNGTAGDGAAGPLVDLRAHASHNRIVIRRCLLAALLCVFAWVAADRLAPCSSESVASAGSRHLCASDNGGSTDSSDHQWNARHPTSSSAHESVWRSQLHHWSSRAFTSPTSSWPFQTVMHPIIVQASRLLISAVFLS